MKSQSRWLIVNLSAKICMLLVASVCAMGNAFAGQPESGDAAVFACGGRVEAAAWQLWDGDVGPYIQKELLQKRLAGQGDVYALYDFQIQTDSLVSMARRCGRVNRLREFARMVAATYMALAPGVPPDSGRRWICKGGSICNSKNRLINTEVKLDSVQFLGFATAVANAIAASGESLTPADQEFIRSTSQISIEHLMRWSADPQAGDIEKRIRAKPQDVTNGESSLFFTDKDLWQIVMFSELAGIAQKDSKAGSGLIPESAKSKLSGYLASLLRLFQARISSLQLHGNGQNALGADLDRGYWRLYADNKYAGYQKPDKPVICRGAGPGAKLEVKVPAQDLPVSETLGWDISHARRLVPALDALARNRQALVDQFHLSSAQVPPADLVTSFANTLVGAVWNGDGKYPLFSNWWNGANGWYRVAYDVGTGQCVEGTPPYGLSDSFPTGGYIAWGQRQPMVEALGRQLFSLSESSEPADAAFIAEHYPKLGKGAGESGAISRLMFLSSVVGNAAAH